MFLPEQHLDENLAKLTAKFERATADKLKCQQEAEATAGTISLANRLVSAGSARSFNYISGAVKPEEVGMDEPARAAWAWGEY